MFKFELLHICKQSGARLGRITTNSGSFLTPVFMPVGTNGTIKTLSTDEIYDISSGIILANTYHLMLSPGREVLALNQGIKKMMGYKGPMLTDSGGFQVFSLNKINKITDEGVYFKNHLNGDQLFISPEESINMQHIIGSDIMMAFDECVALPAKRKDIIASVNRTTNWFQRCLSERDKIKSKQALFGIFQGGLEKDQRIESLKQISALKPDGLAIGGLSVGESRDEMYQMLEFLKPYYPKDIPHYLMGVGDPRDFLKAILEGVDMMDCVMPSRNARHGSLFTFNGRVNIKNAKYKQDLSPIDDKTPGYQNKYNRSYLHHLFKAKEQLGLRIATFQNLNFMKELTKKAQEAIKNDCFLDFYNHFIKTYQ